jgi:hypothetical protein
VFPGMDDQKDLWIFDPRPTATTAPRFSGAAFTVVLSLPIWCSLRGWCCESAMICCVPITVRGQKYMVPEWTVAQLDRACGCRPAAA